MLVPFLMANAAHNAPKLKIGNLTPEEAERLASTFRPVWELDDAPFAQGSALSASDVDALGAGAGVAPSVRNNEQHYGTFEIKTQVTPPPRVPGPAEPKVEIAVDVEPEPAPPPPQVVAQAQPQPQPQAAPRRAYTPPQAPPTPVRMSRDAAGSGEFVPVKKSNTGLILAVIGVVAIVGGIVGLRAMMSGSKASTATTATTSEPTHEATTAAIPPPPPETAATQPQQATPEPTAKATETAAPVETAPPTHPAVTHHTAPAPTAAVTHAATHPTTHHAGHTTHHGGHATIVRDNPF
jgi:hypothetical protein